MSSLKMMIAERSIVVCRGAQFVMSVPFHGRKLMGQVKEPTFWSNRKGNPRDIRELLHVFEYSCYEESDSEVVHHLIQILAELSLHADLHPQGDWGYSRAA